MKIFKPETKVTIGVNIKGVINEVLITSNEKVEYKISWWDCRNRKNEWFESHEVSGRREDKKDIGFHE